MNQGKGRGLLKSLSSRINHIFNILLFFIGVFSLVAIKILTENPQRLPTDDPWIYGLYLLALGSIFYLLKLRKFGVFGSGPALLRIISTYKKASVLFMIAVALGFIYSNRYQARAIKIQFSGSSNYKEVMLIKNRFTGRTYFRGMADCGFSRHLKHFIPSEWNLVSHGVYIEKEEERLRCGVAGSL